MTPVAVVIVCHGLGRTLRDALASVVEQTVQPSELLIVDDGSSDLYTVQQLASLEEGGHRINRLEHSGVSAARNAGIKATVAPLVVLLDADDTLEPRYLETAAGHLDAHPELGFVTCGMRSSGEINNQWFPPEPTLVNVLSYGVPHIASMFRRTAFERAGGFDERLHGFEDTEFWVAMLASGARGAVLPEALFNYRLRPRSLHARATRPDTHVDAWTRIYRKHAHTLAPYCLELVRAKESFAIQQREHYKAMVQEHAMLSERLADLERECAEALGELACLGLPPVDFGELNRLTPVSDRWGIDRGLPVDRHYIDRFVEQNRDAITGHVLEVKDPGYTHRFGAATVVDVIDIDPDNRSANIVADLSAADVIASDTYDCIVLTQTLGLVRDVPAALAHVARVLKPGGTLLVSLPATGRLSPEGDGLDGDFWRFTEASVRALLTEHFPPGSFTVEGFGNPLTNAAFVYGYAAEELPQGALEVNAPAFPIVYCARARKPASAPAAFARARRQVAPLAAILMYHRFHQDLESGDPTATRTSVLREQLDALCQDGWTFVSLAELAMVLDSRLPRKVVAVTVDDGYLDGPRLAQQIFRAFECPVTYFVVTDALRGDTFWWDTFDELWAALPVPSNRALDIAGSPLALSWRTNEELGRTRTMLRALMHTLSAEDARRVVRELERMSGRNRPAASGSPVLRIADLLELSREPGVSIGSHSVDHSWLLALPADERRRQITESKQSLERTIGRPVHAFGYPYGGSDPLTVRLVAEAGYTLAVGTEDRLARCLDSRLMLPRIDAGGVAPEALVSRLRRPR